MEQQVVNAQLNFTRLKRNAIQNEYNFSILHIFNDNKKHEPVESKFVECDQIA